MVFTVEAQCGLRQAQVRNSRMPAIGHDHTFSLHPSPSFFRPLVRLFYYICAREMNTCGDYSTFQEDNRNADIDSLASIGMKNKRLHKVFGNDYLCFDMNR